MPEGTAARGAQAPTSSGYSALDRMLHRLALASPARAEMLHDIERAAFLKSAPPDSGNHVFVTGLARAGTTILMREIHATGAFGSLTYADMPFVLAPNLWARLRRSSARPAHRAERAHGDGIEVGTDSPEALDEVFWRVFDGRAYIRPDGLVPHAPGPDLIHAYSDLVRLILRRTGKSRYVCKNNNLILRLPALASAMPRAHFLIPLRHPLDHAASLLRQHRRFARADAFTRDYMTWLGHHEFGATHRPFVFGRAPRGNPEHLDYWLDLWILAHRSLAEVERAQDSVLFVPHERLASDPGLWQRLARRIEATPGPARELRPRSGQPGETGRALPHDPALAETAEALHDALLQRAIA
ncbi:sulfotransferase family protein [Albidovulum inexpectatum]|uniref:Sulfotransferase family protein n=1 Tax=Albidovulum inexpectatum TaxID=196587 RepID=A0A2S5JLX4_9RHOB|nr:sulfotransferase [Albidovulum inexpectatum]PPB82494.1 sulfotransferase family protein [Albidovulum inexpectatum]